MVSNDEILALFGQWNAALATRDAAQLTALYAPDAILLPTFSSKLRHTPDEIRDYFEQTCGKVVKGTIDEANIRVFGNLAVNSGLYTLSFSDGSSVPARFTLVYRREGDEWKIVEHHSSRLPE